jgi:hypothetical protein
MNLAGTDEEHDGDIGPLRVALGGPRSLVRERAGYLSAGHGGRMRLHSPEGRSKLHAK